MARGGTSREQAVTNAVMAAGTAKTLDGDKGMAGWAQLAQAWALIAAVLPEERPDGT